MFKILEKCEKNELLCLGSQSKILTCIPTHMGWFYWIASHFKGYFVIFESQRNVTQNIHFMKNEDITKILTLANTVSFMPYEPLSESNLGTSNLTMGNKSHSLGQCFLHSRKKSSNFFVFFSLFISLLRHSNKSQMAPNFIDADQSSILKWEKHRFHGKFAWKNIRHSQFKFVYQTVAAPIISFNPRGRLWPSSKIPH